METNLQLVVVTLVVVKGNQPSLLGRNWLEKLVERGTIEAVGHLEWATPIVPIRRLQIDGKQSITP